MTDDLRKETEDLLALEAQATPGPWGLNSTSSGGRLVTRGDPENPRRVAQASVQIVPAEDAELIVALRNRAPALLRQWMERVEELERESAAWKMQAYDHGYHP